VTTESTLARAIREIPKCLAAGIVDLDSGMLLGLRTAEALPHEPPDLVAAVTKELFEGSHVLALENTFKRVRGVENNEHYFQEILVTSRNLIHYFGRVDGNERHVFVAVCLADTNLGLILTGGRTLIRSEQ